MGFVCDDFGELKLVIRCVLTASKMALTVEELWHRVVVAFGGEPNCLQLEIFELLSFDELLKSIPDVVLLEDPTDANSIVNLVSSELSRHMEILVSTNILRPLADKNDQQFRNELLIPYRVQCAFIRIFIELYPEGLAIGDFVSNVLCAPIFKSFADSVELLLYNLNHIFKKVGTDMIILQPTISDGVKNIEEKNKFSARDIFDIDEFSLESSEDDDRIAKGIEYPLSDIIEESIKINIKLLLDEMSNGILEREICDFYVQKFGSSFSHFRRWGFSRVSQLLTKLPELCCVNFLPDEIEIVPTKNHICDVDKKANEIEKVNEHECVITKKDTTDNRPNENDGVLHKRLRNDNLLLTSLDECFLDQELQFVKLEANAVLNVNICNVNSDGLPIVLCQIFNDTLELDTLLNTMEIFYFQNESKFRFNLDSIMIKQTYACRLNNSWFRGSVIKYEHNEIKIMNVDNGLIHTMSPGDVRLLSKKFSQLPAQAFTCSLYGILAIDVNVLSQMIDKKFTICVVSVKHCFKIASVKIKPFNSTLNDYLNDEWIQNGYAEPDNSMD